MSGIPEPFVRILADHLVLTGSFFFLLLIGIPLVTDDLSPGSLVVSPNSMQDVPVKPWNKSVTMDTSCGFQEGKDTGHSVSLTPNN